MTTGPNEAALAQLNDRIGALRSAAARTRTAQLAADLDSVRLLAIGNGFAAVTPIVHAIEAALARGERGAAVAGGLALLQDAACCGNDPRGGDLLARVYQLRIGG